MRKTLLALAALSASVLTSPALADEQVWAAVSVQAPVAMNSRLLVSLDGHTRFRNGSKDLDNTMIRPALGWRVNPRLDLFMGYAVTETQMAGPNRKEERLWQQAGYTLADGPAGRLTGRTRLEQRFREGGNDTGDRVRQMIRFTHPIAQSPFSLVASDELFVALNDTDWGQEAGIDQNRVFLGGGWQASKALRVELGYMNQYIRVADGPDRTNHNLVLTTAFRF
jgi:hypothetical protein